MPQVARLAHLEVWAISRTPDADRSALLQAPLDVTTRVFADESVRRSYPTRDSAAARAALRGCLSGAEIFDVIHVEGHYLFHLLPEEVHRRAVVVEHNVESHLLRQTAVHSGLTPGLAADIDAVAQAEEHAWRRAGAIVTLSMEDQARILRREPGTVVRIATNGADHVRLGVASAANRSPGRRPVFGFLANYAYPPNADALGWLLNEIFPTLSRELPGCRLVLVGSSLPEALEGRSLPGGVEAWGWLDDLSRFWGGVDVLLCPLRIGGGIKVKLIEAIRAGALAVSTSVGLEGLPAAAREAIVQADTSAGIAQAATRLVRERGLREAQRIRIARAQQVLPTWQSAAETIYGYWLGVAQPVLGGIVGR
jgi:glycosyltransferase involved in cell wall biosynthesis